MFFDHFQRFRDIEVSWKSMLRANHIFVAGHADFACNMGRSIDDIHAAQLAFVLANRAAVYRVVNV